MTDERLPDELDSRARVRHRVGTAADTGARRRVGWPIGTVLTDSSANEEVTVNLAGVTTVPGGSAGGDLTGTYPNPTLAAAGGGAAGPTGSATVTPIVTVDAKGRVTALSSATTVPTNAAGGALAGNYPNPTLAWITRGAGDPETVVTAPVGSLFLRTDGGVDTTLYVKESGSGNTGWVGK